MVVKLLAFVFFLLFPPLFKGPLCSLPRSGGGAASWQLQKIFQRHSALAITDGLGSSPLVYATPTSDAGGPDLSCNRNGLNTFSFLYLPKNQLARHGLAPLTNPSL